ncbi:hypothetical protein F4604DRAFT_1924787 [Suillus subluteus]|nr:hypothetical protein F4604DRAFT_1924787 [Suillus subluteus]
MKFTLLTTAFVTAAAMAGVVIASDVPVVPVGTPAQGTPEKATHPDATKFCDKPDTFGCSKGVEGYNEGNDFGYTCASKGQFKSLVECTCKDCCHLIEDGKKPSCPEKKKVTPDEAKLCDKAEKVGCSKGIEGYNNGNDFEYTCASEGHFKSLVKCTCKDCCRLKDDGKTACCTEKGARK